MSTFLLLLLLLVENHCCGTRFGDAQNMHRKEMWFSDVIILHFQRKTEHRVWFERFRHRISTRKKTWFLSLANNCKMIIYVLLSSSSMRRRQIIHQKFMKNERWKAKVQAAIIEKTPNCTTIVRVALSHSPPATWDSRTSTAGTRAQPSGKFVA